MLMARIRAALRAFADPDLVVEALEMRDTVVAIEHGEVASLTVARVGGKPHPVVLRKADPPERPSGGSGIYPFRPGDR
jgi:hypothetical protein